MPRLVNESIFDEAWDGMQRDLFVYLTSTKVADAWGMFRENAKAFAAVLGYAERDVQERLDRLAKQEVFYRYSADGTLFCGVFRKWRDHQQHSYFPKKGTNLPIPPLWIFRKLSAKTIVAFGKISKLPSTSTSTSTYKDVIAEARKTLEEEGVRVMRELDESEKTAHRAAITSFDTAIKSHTGLAAPPGWTQKDVRHAASYLKERLVEGDTGEDLLRCIAEYFKRKRSAEQRAATAGRKINTNVSFVQFRGQYTSLLGSVADAAQVRE